MEVSKIAKQEDSQSSSGDESVSSEDKRRKKSKKSAASSTNAGAGDVFSPMLQKVLKKSTMQRKSYVSSSLGTVTSKSASKSKRSSLVESQQRSDRTQSFGGAPTDSDATKNFILSGVSQTNFRDILSKLAQPGTPLDKNDLQFLFDPDTWCKNMRTNSNEAEIIRSQLKALIRNCCLPENSLMLSFFHKLLTDLMVKTPYEEHNIGASILEGGKGTTLNMCQFCVSELCSENQQHRQQFFQSLNHHVMTRFMDSPLQSHQNLIGHLTAVSISTSNNLSAHKQVNSSTSNQGSGFKEAVRNLILSILSQLENKLHYGKRSVLPTVEIYLEFLFKDILQKFTSYSIVAESSSKINNACDTSSNDITIGSAIKASEAKLTFSFYCRKLKDYVYDSTLRYLPFVYVSACSIHASFHEHLVRVLWDSFKLDHSIASLHWLVSLVCDCNLVQLPLVKDVMRHLSLFLCKLMKSRAAMFSAATASVARSASVTSYINLNGHDSRGANSGKVDPSTASSSEQFVAKQDFVFAFYALLELLVQFEWELMDSDAGVAFVKSLRMDKFICCELQPLAFLPTELLEQFGSLAAKHSTIFPNIRLFMSVSPKISPDERKDLKVTRQRPFQVKFDLEKCKWAVEPYLRVPIMSSENRVFDDEDSRMSYDLESNCSSSVVGESECSEHRMDNSCDAEMADELALYSSFNSAASKAISDWLI